MEGPSATRPSFRNKKRLCPLWDKSVCSCDTTQIDTPRGMSARLRVPSYAPRWITGGCPSASTAGAEARFKPPSEVHSPAAARSVSTVGSSLEIGLRRLLLFLAGFICILLRPLYACPRALSTVHLTDFARESGGAVCKSFTNRRSPAPHILAEMQIKVSPAFSKAAESRGRASGRAPQGAKLLSVGQNPRAASPWSRLASREILRSA